MSLRRPRCRRRSRCLPHKRNALIALKWFWRKRKSVVSAATSLVLRFPWHPCHKGHRGAGNEEEELYATDHSNTFASPGVIGGDRTADSATNTCAAEADALLRKTAHPSSRYRILF